MRLLRNVLSATLVYFALSAAQPAYARALVEPSPGFVAPIADSWSWGEFVKFWKRQLDRTAGVVGVVMLVAAGATLIIVSKTRR